MCDRGRIWVGQDPSALNLVVLSKSDKFIHVRVMCPDNITPFFLSCIYARNKEVDQACLWNSLRGVRVSMANDPWLLLGDFNVYHNNSKMRGGNTSIFGYAQV